MKEWWPIGQVNSKTQIINSQDAIKTLDVCFLKLCHIFACSLTLSHTKHQERRKEKLQISGQFSFQRLCSIIQIRPVYVTPSAQSGIYAVTYPVVQFQSLCYALRIRATHVQQGMSPRVHNNMGNYFPKLLSPCDLPGTFWLSGNPHFGPPARRMGLYLSCSVTCLLQLGLFLGPSGEKTKKEWRQ